jgi:hypothetical protein
VTSIGSLVSLSHGLERLALALALDDPDDGRATAELVAVAEKQREAMALALAYAYRRQRNDPYNDVVGRAVVLITDALAQMGP